MQGAKSQFTTSSLDEEDPQDICPFQTLLDDQKKEKQKETPNPQSLTALLQKYNQISNLDSQSKLELLESITKKELNVHSKNEQDYQSDQDAFYSDKYIKCWMQYSQLVCDPHNVYEYMHNKGIGIETYPQIYINWANHLERSNHDFLNSLKVYQKALSTFEVDSNNQLKITRAFRDFHQRLLLRYQNDLKPYLSDNELNSIQQNKPQSKKRSINQVMNEQGEDVLDSELVKMSKRVKLNNDCKKCIDQLNDGINMISLRDKDFKLKKSNPKILKEMHKKPISWIGNAINSDKKSLESDSFSVQVSDVIDDPFFDANDNSKKEVTQNPDVKGQLISLLGQIQVKDIDCNKEAQSLIQQLANQLNVDKNPIKQRKLDQQFVNDSFGLDLTFSEMQKDISPQKVQDNQKSLELLEYQIEPKQNKKTQRYSNIFSRLLNEQEEEKQIQLNHSPTNANQVKQIRASQCSDFDDESSGSNLFKSSRQSKLSKKLNHDYSASKYKKRNTAAAQINQFYTHQSPVRPPAKLVDQTPNSFMSPFGVAKVIENCNSVVRSNRGFQKSICIPNFGQDHDSSSYAGTFCFQNNNQKDKENQEETVFYDCQENHTPQKKQQQDQSKQRASSKSVRFRD